MNNKCYSTNANNKRNKKLAFKNIDPFRLCISKINKTLIDSAEDSDIVMPMYNLLEYSDNHSTTLESLWNYYRDEINDDEKEIDNNNTLNNNKAITSKSFEYKRKTIGSTSDNENRLNAKIVFPLKYLSNFWR